MPKIGQLKKAERKRTNFCLNTQKKEENEMCQAGDKKEEEKKGNIIGIVSYFSRRIQHRHFNPEIWSLE